MAAPGRPQDEPGEILLEFQTVARQTRVAAVDAETGIEVVVFGPASTSRAELERLAVAKLKKRLADGR